MPGEGELPRNGPGDHQIPKPVILVVHGPEIFDCGGVAWLMELLRPSRTIVAGVMARTAAEESGLPVEPDGSPPSRIIRGLSGPVVLANHAKTPASGRIFGNIIATRLAGRGLVQIECAERAVLVWDGGDRDLASRIAEVTGFPVSCYSSTPEKRTDERTIRGCLAGEAVYVNGIVVGQATGDTVIIRKSGSAITAVSGLIVKEHGLEKLAGTDPDPATAWCKSGPIRRSAPGSLSQNAPSAGRVAVIDHCGHLIYTAIGPDCCGVLAIGDDTTAVCGHTCTHRGIPVLGIVDGDRDSILPAGFAPGSVVLLTQGERDDDLGKEVAGMAGPMPVRWGDWVAAVLARLGNRVRIVLDTREPA